MIAINVTLKQNQGKKGVLVNLENLAFAVVIRYL
jgi:hypothetical protein